MLGFYCINFDFDKLKKLNLNKYFKYFVIIYLITYFYSNLYSNQLSIQKIYVLNHYSLIVPITLDMSNHIWHIILEVYKIGYISKNVLRLIIL